MRGAIILAGGKSERLGEDKALMYFRKKRMIEYVVEAAKRVCGKVVISCRDSEQKRRLEGFGECVIDRRAGYGPLEGFYQGCCFLGEGYACILACDMPFLSWRILNLLFECAEGHSAAIPTHPSGKAEPLHSVYNVEETRKACEKVFEAKRKKIFDMIDLLSDVVYVSTERIKEFDPQLKTFININTRKDWEEYG